MSDPIPAISESAATGLIAEIYADIRRVYRVGVVNLIWRHLATIPGGLPWVWSTIRPLYVNGTVGREAAALRAALSFPKLPPWPTVVLSSAGLQDEDIAGIRTVLAAYDRTNAMALLAFLAVQFRLERVLPPGEVVVSAAIPVPAEPERELSLPPMLALSDMSPSTAEVVLAINRLGAIHREPILASMYRHLAHWPAYLALVWTVLAPRSSSIGGWTARLKTRFLRRVPVPGLSLHNCRHRCRRSGPQRRAAFPDQSTDLPGT